MSEHAMFKHPPPVSEGVHGDFSLLSGDSLKLYKLLLHTYAVTICRTQKEAGAPCAGVEKTEEVLISLLNKGYFQLHQVERDRIALWMWNGFDYEEKIVVRIPLAD